MHTHILSPYLLLYKHISVCLRPDVNLVENMEGPVENPAGVELDDVRFTQNMEEFLNNEDWVNDAT